MWPGNRVHRDRSYRFWCWLNVLAFLAILTVLFADLIPDLREGIQAGRPAPFVWIVGSILCVLLAGLFWAVLVFVPSRIVLNLVVKNRRSAYRHETLVLLAVPVLIGAYVALCYRQHQSLKPPEGDVGIEQFAAAMPLPERVTLVDHDGRTYIAWFGELAWLSLPSGPSYYLFDESGRLVDWVPETGDGDRISDMLDAAEHRRHISVEEALSIVEADSDR